ncbi:MAG: glycerate kinase [Mariniphaga sp.]|nr:glycerate kinase [Mariniphaga sp.]
MDHQIHILVAPNSMKGSLDAFTFASAVEEAFLGVSSRFVVSKLPVADGGDFTGEVICRALGATPIKLWVNDPLGRSVEAGYGVSGKTAVIEMADASGLRLLQPGEPDPLRASSYGTGQLIRHALRNGCTEILLGVGGSATIDGGAGMLAALGFQLTGNEGQVLEGNGNNLQHISKIIKPSGMPHASVKVICDVNNPLLGTTGAVAVFGKQKGVTEKTAGVLENGLTRWCHLLEQESGKTLANRKGAGAAGGVALPLITFFDAEIVPGAPFILNFLNFDEQLRQADLVITGEGRIDRQTLHDKAPCAVAKAASKAGKPVIAIGGSIDPEASAAFNGIFSFIGKPLELEESMKNARQLLYEFSVQLARTIDALSK